MKSGLRLVVLSLLLPILVFPQFLSKAPGVNKYVTYRAKPSRASVKPSGMLDLLFTLTPQKGIHINTVPPLSFTLSDSQDVELAGSLKFKTVKVDTNIFLNASKPIAQSLRISKTMQPGQHVVKGELTYYYCSDAEGWCSKFKQPVEVTVSVKK